MTSIRKIPFSHGVNATHADDDPEPTDVDFLCVVLTGVPSIPSMASRSKRQSLLTGTVSSSNDDTVIGGSVVPDAAAQTSAPGCSDLSSSLIVQLSPSYPYPSSSSVPHETHANQNHTGFTSLVDDVTQEELTTGTHGKLSSLAV